MLGFFVVVFFGGFLVWLVFVNSCLGFCVLFGMFGFWRVVIGVWCVVCVGVLSLGSSRGCVVYGFLFVDVGWVVWVCGFCLGGFVVVDLFFVWGGYVVLVLLGVLFFFFVGVVLVFFCLVLLFFCLLVFLGCLFWFLWLVRLLEYCLFVVVI